MKIYESVEQALSCVESGQTIMVGGFGLVGGPLTLIDALVELDVNDLTIISNNLGEKGKGLGKLLEQKKVKKRQLALTSLGIEMLVKHFNVEN